jgi:hypothetical protein
MVCDGNIWGVGGWGLCLAVFQHCFLLFYLLLSLILSSCLALGLFYPPFLFFTFHKVMDVEVVEFVEFSTCS